MEIPKPIYFATTDLETGMIWLVGEQQKLTMRLLIRNGSGGNGASSIPETRPAIEEKLFTVKEAAQKLGTTEGWIYQNSKRLGGYRISHRKLRVPESKLKRYLAQKSRPGI